MDNYKENRKKMYPPLEEQFDLLWKELSETGGITDEGPFYTIIKAVKDTHPKPPVEEETPTE